MTARSITVAVCTECGGIAGLGAHGHAPPVEWHWESEEYVRADQLAGAVKALAKADGEVATLADALRAAGMAPTTVQAIIDSATPRGGQS
jgi:hypothetical protein